MRFFFFPFQLKNQNLMQVPFPCKGSLKNNDRKSQTKMTLHHKSKIGGIVGRQAFDLSRKEIANIESQCPLNWEST